MKWIANRKARLIFDKKKHADESASDNIEDLKKDIIDIYEDIADAEEESEDLDTAILIIKEKIPEVTDELKEIKKKVDLFNNKKITKMVDSIIKDAEKDFKKINELEEREYFDGAITETKKTLLEIKKKLVGPGRTLRGTVLSLERHRKDPHILEQNQFKSSNAT